MRRVADRDNLVFGMKAQTWLSGETAIRGRGRLPCLRLGVSSVEPPAAYGPHCGGSHWAMIWSGPLSAPVKRALVFSDGFVVAPWLRAIQPFWL
jgi:hypothetical protein